ncbi:LysR family transcriptional regulator [Neokomagataea thailandica]|uniref:LysR family transcriptional regulator n=1 Tax=Neokomagataea tanensis NBRC 106556 TaxID=1223519 RepID=A0ABQ0QIJ2_9PROT|nr:MULTISPECIES: LysR family transcriptional regulator [Neokomagataea]GBR45982.1 LysR family transcriptional regulator [Neokomagataea tanensis NBRC 106556]
MIQENLNDLQVFLVVARERSFTRAAAKLGVSQSALSHTIRLLEERLDVRLLTRTTRSVAPTDVGARLIAGIAPSFHHIETELVALGDLRKKPAGSIRITTGDHAAQAYLLPALRRLLPNYPNICIEISVNYGLTDIVAEGYDAGIRLNEQVAKDMIAMPISTDATMAVVGSPDYFERYATPAVPQDLTEHMCINLRTPTHGGLYVWEFGKAGQAVNVRVNGQVIANSGWMIYQSALQGLGLAYLNLNMVREDIKAGRLVRVLADWCETFPGYHLFYPNRRQPSPAFSLLLDALRYRGEK